MSRAMLAIYAGCLIIGNVSVMTGQTFSYDNSALRIEGHLGDIRVVRGVDGTVIGKVGVVRGANLAELVKSSDRAVLEAETFARDYRPGTWFVAIGIAALGINLGVSQIPDVNRAITTGLLLVGTGSLVYGAGRMERAVNALARSIWWYNRDLAR